MLEIVKIESGYSSQSIIKGISLEVPKSKLVTIIGPNGHGKTTLLRSISVSYTHLTLPTNREV